MMGNGRWEGKKFIAFGTSITWNCDSYQGGYLDIVMKRNGFSFYCNAGVSGAAMANHTANGTGINHKIRHTRVTDFDLILIECGTNDFKLNVGLGTIHNSRNKVFDTDTFCGALQDSIEYILKEHPHKHILLIADCQRNHDGYDVDYINPAGYKLLDYIDAMHGIGAFYGLPVCDWYRISGINALTLDLYTYDGLHPNENGYSVLGNVTASHVANMY